MPLRPGTPVHDFLENWEFTRSLTYDLLDVAAPEDLDFSPDESFGTLGRQIVHCARVQHQYRRAIETGSMVAEPFEAPEDAQTDGESLRALLEEEDEALRDELEELDDYALTIEWEQGDVALRDHLTWLLQHEAFHQGQWMVFAALAGLDLPDSWAEAWAI